MGTEWDKHTITKVGEIPQLTATGILLPSDTIGYDASGL